MRYDGYDGVAWGAMGHHAALGGPSGAMWENAIPEMPLALRVEPPPPPHYPTVQVPWYQDGAEQQRTKFSEMVSNLVVLITGSNH